MKCIAKISTKPNPNQIALIFSSKSILQPITPIPSNIS
jgi:hypothetical protein